MRDGFNQGLLDAAKVFPNIVTLDADLATAIKFADFAKEYPDRFFQVGIAEANMAGVAAGLATVGFIPFIGTFACFASCRIADQVRTSIAQPGLNVKIIAPYSGLCTGQTGKTHQAIEDISLYRGMPKVTIVAPADAMETALAVHAIAEYAGPVYLRLTRDPIPAIFGDSHRFEVGRTYLLRKGKHITLISTGSMTGPTLEAASELEKEGVSAAVLHVPTIKPLDEEAVISAVRSTGLVITVEEHNIYGGLGGAIAETLSENYPVPIARIGIRDIFGESGHNEQLLEKYGLKPQHILQVARDWIKKWEKE